RAPVLWSHGAAAESHEPKGHYRFVRGRERRDSHAHDFCLHQFRSDPKLCRADGCAAPFAYFGAWSLGALGCGFWFGVSLVPAVAVLDHRLRWLEFSVDFPKGPVARGCGSSPARKTRW